MRVNMQLYSKEGDWIVVFNSTPNGLARMAKENRPKLGMVEIGRGKTREEAVAKAKAAAKTEPVCIAHGIGTTVQFPNWALKLDGDKLIPNPIEGQEAPEPVRFRSGEVIGKPAVKAIVGGKEVSATIRNMTASEIFAAQNPKAFTPSTHSKDCIQPKRLANV